MTNTNIIIQEGVRAELYTQSEMEAFVIKNGYLQINTFQGWKRLGYTVKKGEKAIIKTKLWRMTNYKNGAESKMSKTGVVIDLTKPNTQGKEQQEEDEWKFNHYYLAEAALFDISQVEKVA